MHLRWIRPYDGSDISELLAFDIPEGKTQSVQGDFFDQPPRFEEDRLDRERFSELLKSEKPGSVRILVPKALVDKYGTETLGLEGPAVQTGLYCMPTSNGVTYFVWNPQNGWTTFIKTYSPNAEKNYQSASEFVNDSRRAIAVSDGLDAISASAHRAPKILPDVCARQSAGEIYAFSLRPTGRIEKHIRGPVQPVALHGLLGYSAAWAKSLPDEPVDLFPWEPQLQRSTELTEEEISAYRGLLMPAHDELADRLYPPEVKKFAKVAGVTEKAWVTDIYYQVLAPYMEAQNQIGYWGEEHTQNGLALVNLKTGHVVDIFGRDVGDGMVDLAATEVAGTTWYFQRAIRAGVALTNVSHWRVADPNDSSDRPESVFAHFAYLSAQSVIFSAGHPDSESFIISFLDHYAKAAANNRSLPSREVLLAELLTFPPLNDVSAELAGLLDYIDSFSNFVGDLWMSRWSLNTIRAQLDPNFTLDQDDTEFTNLATLSDNRHNNTGREALGKTVASISESVMAHRLHYLFSHDIPTATVTPMLGTSRTSLVSALQRREIGFTRREARENFDGLMGDPLRPLWLVRSENHSWQYLCTKNPMESGFSVSDIIGILAVGGNHGPIDFAVSTNVLRSPVNSGPLSCPEALQITVSS